MRAHLSRLRIAMSAGVVLVVAAWSGTARAEEAQISATADAVSFATRFESRAGREAPPEQVIRRIVLDERVLFDTSRARVKSRAHKLIQTLVDAWSIQPEWDRIVIEGHTDDRGDADFNDWLALERAARARAALIARGAPADRIEIVSYGSSRPRSRNRGDTAAARNRRVEFVVLRRVPAE